MSSTIDVNAYENAWLGITEEDLQKAKSPLSGLTDEEKTDFHLHVIQKMRDPVANGSRSAPRSNLHTKRALE